MEYEQYKFIIPKPSRSFWLDPCGIPNGNYPVVNDDGVRDKFGQRPDCSTVSFRPVIEVQPSDGLSYQPGYKVELFGYKWTAVSKTLLVCDSCVAETKFNDTPCLFKDSYLNYRINTYFNELKNQRGIGKPYDPDTAAKSSGTALSTNVDAVSPDIFPRSEILGYYEKSKKTSFANKFFSGLGVCLMGYGLVDFGIGVGSAAIMSFIPAIGLFVSGALVLGAATYFRNKESNSSFYEAVYAADKEYEEKQKHPALKQDTPEVLRELINSSNGGQAADKDADFVQPGLREASSSVQALNQDVSSAAFPDTKNAGKDQFSEIFDTSKITDDNIKQKFRKINLLLSRIVSLQNRSINQKIKIVYLPEIKKLYDIYMKYDGDGIESEGKDTCLALLEDNLDKTLQLLTIEYDKAHEKDILDVNFQTETMQKMLDKEKAIKDITLKM